VQVEDRRCSLTVSPEAQSEVKAMLGAENIHDGDYVVAVNAGGNWDLKRWPQDRFTLLVERLMRQPRVKVVLPGAARDAPMIRKITAPLTHKPANFVGRTNLKQLLALLQRADVVVTADSGPMHMASGVGTDVVGIFGPTRPEITGPRGGGRAAILQYDVGCNREACYHIKCPDNICMKAVTVDDVLKEIEKFRNP